jgi:hypothetical protein
MTKPFLLGLVLSLAMTAQAAARQSPVGQTASAAVAVANATVAHPVHAVLRYDLSTTAACRSLSDHSAELCLLLALHVIRLSEKPLPAGAL